MSDKNDLLCVVTSEYHHREETFGAVELGVWR